MILFIRRRRRERRERIAGARRVRLRQALLGAQWEVLRAAAVRACDDPRAQMDLALAASETIDLLPPDKRALVHRVALDTGLLHSLLAQLASSKAIERGRAVFLLGELRLPDADSLFTRFLSDPDPVVRLLARAKLAEPVTEVAVEPELAKARL